MRLPKDATDDGVYEASEREDKDGVVSNLQDPEPYPSRWGAEHPLQEGGERKEDVEDNGLHSVVTDVVAEGRIAHDAEVECEEGDEGGIGN